MVKAKITNRFNRNSMEVEGENLIVIRDGRVYIDGQDSHIGFSSKIHDLDILKGKVDINPDYVSINPIEEKHNEELSKSFDTEVVKSLVEEYTQESDGLIKKSFGPIENGSLQKRIENTLKSALSTRSLSKEGLEALRVIVGELQRQPEKELTDEKVIKILKKLEKKEKELIQAKGDNYSDLLNILSSFLPEEATDEEIIEWIDDNIAFGAFKNKMQAMKPIMARFVGVDGNRIKKILMEYEAE